MYNYTPYEGRINPSFEGTQDSELLVIAESPWKTEIAAGRPLSGASGNLWNYWLSLAGIDRRELRIENLYPWKPPRIELTSVPDSLLLPWIENLHYRIAAMPNLKMIVTMGNYATFALTGRGKVKASIYKHFENTVHSATHAEKKAGILSLRGSIYAYTNPHTGYAIKVMPVLHPAGVLRMAKWEKRCIVDWKKIAHERTFPQIIEIERDIKMDPAESDVSKFVEDVENNPDAFTDLSIDIETWGHNMKVTGGITCVGFSPNPIEALVIRTDTKGHQKVFMPYIKRLCESPAIKILCNGGYDWYWLDHYGINLVNYTADIQAAHHALDPIESHSLDFLASIYTRQPYWKTEAKDPEEIKKHVNQISALWHYNGLDCCLTYEIWNILKAKLLEEKMWQFYLTHYAGMFEILLRMMRHGTKVDVEAQKEWHDLICSEMAEIREKLETNAGKTLFSTKSKTCYRKPKNAEFSDLLSEDYFKSDDWGSGDVAPPKYINKEARNKYMEAGLTYMMSGEHAGKFRYKKEVVQKGFSPIKLLKFFYEDLGIPKQYARDKATGKLKVTLDEAALRKLNYAYPKLVGDNANLLLRYRSLDKEKQYLSGSQDKDGRIRCFYKLTTEAGRLASSSNPMGTGYNLQNIKQ